jgi:hypothetical protein
MRHLTYYVAAEQITDRHIAAEDARMAARAADEREPRDRSTRRGRIRFGLRRPKLA